MIKIAPVLVLKTFTVKMEVWIKYNFLWPTHPNTPHRPSCSWGCRPWNASEHPFLGFLADFWSCLLTPYGFILHNTRSWLPTSVHIMVVCNTSLNTLSSSITQSESQYNITRSAPRTKNALFLLDHTTFPGSSILVKSDGSLMAPLLSTDRQISPPPSTCRGLIETQDRL